MLTSRMNCAAYLPQTVETSVGQGCNLQSVEGAGRGTIVRLYVSWWSIRIHPCQHLTIRNVYSRTCLERPALLPSKSVSQDR